MSERPVRPSSELNRPPQLIHAAAAIGLTAAILGIGFGFWRAPAEVLLVISTCAVGAIGAAFGLTWREAQAGALQSIAKGMPAMLVVIVVGALVASWIAAGIIPMMVYYGLGLVSARYFLVTASAAAAVVSILTGTGYGTIGTIGVAFMGIAHGLGVPPGPAAGALVAGAYVGDKISPFAANANLAVAATGAQLYDHIAHCLRTTVPALLAGFIVYFLVGGAGHGSGAGVDAQLRAVLARHFVFSPWLLLPPAVSAAAMLLRRPVVPSMLLSAGLAAILAVLVQHLAIGATLAALTDGYAARTGNAAADHLLSQGGMMGMMRVTLIALAAFAYGGVLQKAGLLEPLLQRLLSIASRPGRLILTSGAACIAVELLTGSAFLCILLPGELFAPAYERLGLAPENLSRTIGDCGIVGVPLIPWSIAGAFMTSTLGVPVSAYAPWAVFCYAGAAFTLIAGLTGWSVVPRAAAAREAAS